MSPGLPFEETFGSSLPLPLAQLYRRAHNAKSALERHQTAFYLWEASLKLLGAVCVVAYVRLDVAEAGLEECLQNLARPALGHWWELVRRLVPVLAGRGVVGFAPVRDLLLSRRRDDLPRTAGLDALLRPSADGWTPARTVVCLAEVFDRLVQYRNKEIGHGATGQRPGTYYDRMGRALLAATVELLGRLDVRAGRRLVYVAEVREVGGCWKIERFELAGEAPRRLEPLEWARDRAPVLPSGERVYLLEADGSDLIPLHPLVVYDTEANEFAFLSARRGRTRAEYLGYSSGRTATRPDLGGEQRILLARALGLETVSEQQAGAWAERSCADEPAETLAGPARRMVGEYELLSELGRGGMGVVYRAWQPTLGRQVALKCLLKPGDPKAEARFRREIRALGRVEHPHLMKVFTSGSDGDQWFYVMELVEGASLETVAAKLSAGCVTAVDLPAWQAALSTAVEAQRSREKPLSEMPRETPALTPERPEPTPVRRSDRGYVHQVATLVMQAAEAAEALHRNGVIHRDVKPGNILVSASGERATLMDLGLAQLADDAEGRLTRTRQFVGTLRYASPEQVLAVAPVGPRSDVYSLGATLWELLTLRPLFGATEGLPTPEAMNRIQFADPERPRKYNRNVPRDLEAVVLKCLEKNPERRYASARDLADDLGNWLAGRPVRARVLTWRYRARKFLGRHRAAVAAAAGGLLAALLLYTAFADAGFQVPGGEAVRSWVDSHNSSVFRPVPGDAVIGRTAGGLRRDLFAVLLRSRTKAGWVPRDLTSGDEVHVEVWSHCQALCALVRTPEAEPAQLRTVVEGLERPFTPGLAIETDGTKYGWPVRPPEENNPLAEPALWTAAALSAALGRPGLLEGEDRARALAHLAYTQEVLQTYHPQEMGGWNMYPGQHDPGLHNPYTTSLALLALLEMRQAGLPWKGDAGRRDALLATTAQWLVDAYDERSEPPGWRAPGLSTYKVFDGLTLQIYALLLRAEAEADFALPEHLVRHISARLTRCVRRGLDFEDTVGKFHVLCTDGLGKQRLAQESVTFLWYPWSIECASRWLQRANRCGAPMADCVQVRRALAHLVIDLGPAEVARASKEWTFVASETLLALSAVAPAD
jgi:serine/threonine protein kinase